MTSTLYDHNLAIVLDRACGMVQLGESFVSRRQEHRESDDEDEDEATGDILGASGESDESQEPRYHLSATVIEDMRQLTRMFREKGMRYQLIDKIGEGKYALSLSFAKMKAHSFRDFFYCVQS